MEYSKDYLFVFFIMIMVIYLFKLQQEKTKTDTEYDKRMQMMSSFIKFYKSRIDENKGQTNNPELNPINVEIGDINVTKPVSIPVETKTEATGDIIYNRDKAVVNNALYPPLGRMPRPLVNDYVDNKDGLFNQPTRYSGDTYRLMAYLINTVDKTDKWNVYGRQRYSGSSRGDFYAVQQCSNDPCIKFDLNDDIMTGEKIRDFYNLPNELSINSPLFSTDPYTVVQLKTNLSYSPYF